MQIKLLFVVVVVVVVVVVLSVGRNSECNKRGQASTQPCCWD